MNSHRDDRELEQDSLVRWVYTLYGLSEDEVSVVEGKL